MAVGDQDAALSIKLLQAASMAEAEKQALDVQELASDIGTSEAAIAHELGELDARGLMLTGIEEGLPPMLRRAGRQYLARDGTVPLAVLSFLPHTIDDLDAREALIFAGLLLVDEFRSQLLSGGVSRTPANSCRPHSSRRSTMRWRSTCSPRPWP
jgi:hypothetical protein